MIVLFDGICNLCTRSVQFILPRDEKARMRFASLQSAYAKSALAQYGLPLQDPPESIVLIDEGRAYIGSDAALRILGALRFPWNLARVLLLIPRGLRDWLYKRIALNRYAWFGQKGQCWLPQAHWRDRFIE